MAYLPDLMETGTSRMMTEIFAGYDHNLKIADGSWYDEKNLTSASYPLFSPRARRGTIRTLSNPQGVIMKDELAYVDGSTLYYNGSAVPGITLSTAPEDCPKQLVSMGAYICVFPDGVYLNTKDINDRGRMAAEYTAPGTVELQLCRQDGTAYDPDRITVSDTEPVDPQNGDMWIDTSESRHILKQYSESSAIFVQIPTTYIRIVSAGIGHAFDDYDGVTISGVQSGGDIHDEQIGDLNADHIIMHRDDNSIVVIGIIDRIAMVSGLRVERRVPKMDYVCELDNRLWGCFYGVQDGKALNEIYCCALGNPKVWNRYMGISTDSYTVSLGSDGAFTGMIAYGGYVLAFKESCIHKVYGTMPSNFQVTTTACRGVQKGSERSLAIVNERLYYKSRTDVCAYDGSLPVGVSDAFAGQRFFNARAGAFGSTYMISMQDESGKWIMMTFDTARGIWHKEDDTQALMFAPYNDDLIYIDADSRSIVSATGRNGDAEGAVTWDAISGIIGYEYPDQKYISRFNLRMRMTQGSKCEVLVQYDSDGIWISQGEISGTSTASFTVPVIPRRCDHMQIRLTGSGQVYIYSIAKILEIGSDA